MRLTVPADAKRRSDTISAEAEARAVVDEMVASERIRWCPCGRQFEPYRKFQRYCSDAHRVKYSGGKRATYAKRPTAELTCALASCGKKFRTNDGKRRYCSPECYAESRELRVKKLEKRNCFECGKVFETTHWLKRFCDDCGKRRRGKR